MSLTASCPTCPLARCRNILHNGYGRSPADGDIIDTAKNQHLLCVVVQWELAMGTDGKPDRGLVQFNSEECKGCGLCVEACPPKVLHLSGHLNHSGYHPAEYLGSGCTGCGICFFACPEPGGISVMRRVA